MATFMLLATTTPSSLASEADDSNPFFSRYGTPYETPAFDRITIEHFMPAFRKGMEAQKKEIQALVEDRSLPTFANTIVALDRSGMLLSKVNAVFGALRSANTNDWMDSLATAVTPLLTAHRNDISLNEELFHRIRAVHEKRGELALTTEDAKLLDNTFRDFVRGGANLGPEAKQRLRAINEELSALSLRFSQNLLKETNSYRLIVERQEDLAGLPPAVIQSAAALGEKAGMSGKWVFTVQKPSLIPFLQYAQNRSLREKLFKAYINRGDNNNPNDNKRILARIAALRVARARLLGYRTHAEYVIEENMAKTPAAVNDLLQRVWQPALKVAQKERDAMQAMIRHEGGTFTLQAWDWWYYAEKVKKAEYDVDENALRPYFRMENVRQGVFDVAGKLFGIRFVPRPDIPRYADDVDVFEVQRFDGSHVGILYTDYFPRPGKSPGAWMGSFRGRERIGDTVVTPVVYNVGNFSRPAGDTPALLTLDEVETLFHEFGHGLFGLLSGRSYRNLPLPRDGVELPSQIMENWALVPEVLRSYARHYKTQEPIPEEVIEKIKKSQKFNQGFATVEYVAAALLDMDWHSLTDTAEVDANAFERRTCDRIRLMPEIAPRYRSSNFGHIFSGGYSAGYYNYLWAEVLDADAFEAFKEHGLFDRKTAESFRKNILELGGTEDLMLLYERFRGRKPSVEPLMKKRGLL
jgi:peptidyl-dipeptidase Dcp